MTDTRPYKLITVNNTVKLANNSIIQQLFNADRSISFVVGEVPANQVLFSKGHESDPSQGSWAIINENYYLKIVLHEQNGVNSLVFKSSTPILQTRLRPFITINWINSLKNIELFFESLPCSFALDTSQVHYRISTSQFTGLRVTNDDLIVGRGVTITNKSFKIFYLLGEKKLSQEEINQYYQSEKDSRVLDPLGKIIFSSNRDGAVYKIHEMNEDGTDVQLKYGIASNDMLNPLYAHDGSGFSVATNGMAIYRDNSGNIKSSIGLSVVRTAILTLNKQYLIYDHSDNVHGKDIIANSTHFDFNSLSTGTNVGYWNNYPLHSNPTNTSKFLITRMSSGNAHTLVERNFSNNTEFQIFSTPYNASNYNQKIFGARYSKDGTKVGFNVYYNDSGTDYRAYICNINGTGLTLLAQSSISTPTDFCAFSPDGTKVLLSKTVSDIGYTNKKQLFIRDLVSNLETQITFHNSNNYQADWKA